MEFFKNETIKRSFFGAIYCALIIVSILLGQYVYFSFLITCMLICLKEFSNIVSLKGFHKIYLYTLALGFFWVSSKYYFVYYNGNLTIFSIVISIFLLLIYELFRKDYKNTMQNISSILIAIVYIVIPFSLAMKIPSQKTLFYTPEIILIFFISIWLNDSFAYIFGKTLGKRKLYEVISPKKTIEGFLGGMVLTISCTFIFKMFTSYLNLIDILAITFISVFFGTIGDLIESMFKRIHSVKDSGNIIPGHGGLLDRLDSFIFSVPFIYLYFFITSL